LALQAAAKREHDAVEEQQQRAAEGTLTLGAMLDRFIEVRSHGDRAVRPATLVLWHSLARSEIKPALGPRDPRSITRKDVKRLHRAIGERGRRPWANRVVELLRPLYTWAVDEEMLEASPIVNIKPNEERPRTRVLTSDEIRAVWEALVYEPLGDAIRLLFWTA